jgi:hypothetical protein
MSLPVIDKVRSLLGMSERSLSPRTNLLAGN